MADCRALTASPSTVDLFDRIFHMLTALPEQPYSQGDSLKIAGVISNRLKWQPHKYKRTFGSWLKANNVVQEDIDSFTTYFKEHAVFMHVLDNLAEIIYSIWGLHNGQDELSIEEMLPILIKLLPDLNNIDDLAGMIAKLKQVEDHVTVLPYGYRLVTFYSAIECKLSSSGENLPLPKHEIKINRIVDHVRALSGSFISSENSVTDLLYQMRQCLFIHSACEQFKCEAAAISRYTSRYQFWHRLVVNRWSHAYAVACEMIDIIESSAQYIDKLQMVKQHLRFSHIEFEPLQDKKIYQFCRKVNVFLNDKIREYESASRLRAPRI